MPDTYGCLGIVELGHDILFHAIASNWNTHEGATHPGTFSIWDIDMRDCAPEQAKVQKVLDMPEAAFWNGMAVLNTCGWAAACG